MKTTNTN